MKEYWLELCSDCDDIIWRHPVNENTIHVIEYSEYEKLTKACEIMKEALEFYSVNGLAEVRYGDRMDDRLAQLFYVTGGFAREALSKSETLLNSQNETLEK
jgi:hypothetical protein